MLRKIPCMNRRECGRCCLLLMEIGIVVFVQLPRSFQVQFMHAPSTIKQIHHEASYFGAPPLVRNISNRQYDESTRIRDGGRPRIAYVTFSHLGSPLDRWREVILPATGPCV